MGGLSAFPPLITKDLTCWHLTLLMIYIERDELVLVLAA